MPVTYVPVKIAAATTAKTLTHADSGSVFYVEDLTGDCTFTLPSNSAGIWYEFMYAGVAADAQDWVFQSASATNYFLGGVVHLDTDADAAGDEVVMVASDGNSNDFFRVLVPQPGTRVRIESIDDTNWVVSGYVVAATAPTFADT